MRRFGWLVAVLGLLWGFSQRRQARLGYRIQPFPLTRRLVVDSVRLGKRKASRHQLIEADVTAARRALHVHEAAGEELSFTAFLLACLGRAGAEQRALHACRDWRGRHVLFDDVNVNTIIEIELQGQKFPLAYVLRAANRRSPADLTAEIRHVQHNPPQGLNSPLQQAGMVAFLLLPTLLRDLCYALALHLPRFQHHNMGTVILTAVGMFGQGGGWGIGAGLYPLSLTVGGIAHKPRLVDGQLEAREVLSLTLEFDRTLSSEGPATRFADRLRQLIESGYGLIESAAFPQEEPPMPSKPGYEIKPIPRMRRLTADIGRIARSKHMIHGLLELDVTAPRRRLAEHKAATGEALSFTAFLVYCVAREVEANRYLHALRDWRGRLVLFDDVDVLTLIEVEADGLKFPIGHVVRAANRKPYLAIHQEIRGVQTAPRSSGDAQAIARLIYIPRPLRRLFFFLVEKLPGQVRQYRGTVSVTAVGMFGTGSGWGISAPTHTLSLTVGGIATKPGLVDEQITPREYLNLTLSFDHDIVDGAPAARFSARLRERIESGEGLPGA